METQIARMGLTKLHNSAADEVRNRLCGLQAAAGHSSSAPTGRASPNFSSVTEVTTVGTGQMRRSARGMLVGTPTTYFSAEEEGNVSRNCLSVTRTTMTVGGETRVTRRTVSLLVDRIRFSACQGEWPSARIRGSGAMVFGTVTTGETRRVAHCRGKA